MRLAFAAVLLLLAVVIGIELRPGNRPSAPAAAPDAAQQAVAPAIAGVQDDAWVRTMLARPLFSPSRRPPEGAAASAATRQPVPRLAGIVMVGDRRTAIFASPAGQRPITVSVGDAIEGFRVEAINASGVVLAGAGERRTVRPSFDGEVLPPPPAAAVPAPAPVPGAFNGPPGLNTMPKAPAPGPAGPPGLPGLPNIGDLSGIPGLSPPPAPLR